MTTDLRKSDQHLHHPLEQMFLLTSKDCEHTFYVMYCLQYDEELKFLVLSHHIKLSNITIQIPFVHLYMIHVTGVLLDTGKRAVVFASG